MKNLTEIFSIDINSESEIENLQKKIEELKSTGIKKFTIKIFGEPDAALQNKGIDAELFGAIKDKQALPDEVVLAFLKCKGSLNDSKFERRIKW